MKNARIFTAAVFITLTSLSSSAGRVWLYTPPWYMVYGTTIAGKESGASESKWVAQPFHVPFDSYADYFGAFVGKGADPNNAGMKLRLVNDNIIYGWPGETIAEWSIFPQTASLNWAYADTQPILLRSRQRYWLIAIPGDSKFVGQIGLSGGEMWALRSFDQGAYWDDWGFRAAIRVGGYAVPEFSGFGVLAFISAALLFSRRRLSVKKTV